MHRHTLKRTVTRINDTHGRFAAQGAATHFAPLLSHVAPADAAAVADLITATIPRQDLVRHIPKTQQELFATNHVVLKGGI
jgi:hypothetical protein